MPLKSFPLGEKKRKPKSEIMCVHWALLCKRKCSTKKRITFYTSLIFINIKLASIHLLSSPRFALQNLRKKSLQ